ncbi:replication initiation protein [Niabella ginsengisoli]|uniref:Replication initiation protein n=1 Tax=Niabella ginsengisoli TaxID=522298 RepID=A0ABS9SMA5_9BACT|nr:replication initiation protein [Niabella ginsengisoli]MCH5599513.1 replication initiation protein [Niabella ginsengisoli]
MKPTNGKNATRKSTNAVILPGCTELYQPNRVTYGRGKLHRREGGFTLMQSRVLITLIKELQEAVLASMNGKDWQALPVYLSKENNLIRVPIRLKDIAHPRQYREVYEAALELGKASIELPSAISKEYYCIATLFPRVELPKVINGNSIMYVELFKDAARKLIEIDRTSNDRPGYFTRYLYEVAMKATNKYTYKLYMIIASWKQKGGFRISFDELKQLLGISANDYTAYKEFKRRVLLPVQKDLEGKSDCWFNCAAEGFEQRTNKSVQWLNFKIIVPTPACVVNGRLNHILHLLRTHFYFNEEETKTAATTLNDLLSNEQLYQSFLQKLTSLNEYIRMAARTANPVNNISRYVLKSIIGWVNNKTVTRQAAKSIN